jgi:hypothetical protein
MWKANSADDVRSDLAALSACRELALPHLLIGPTRSWALNEGNDVLINEGDRVISDTGEKGKVERIAGFGALAFIRLEESTRGAHLTLFNTEALTVIAEAGGAATETIRGIVRQADV